MVTVQVHADRTLGPQEHFWRSTGFDPATLLLTPVMQQTVRYCGSIPHQGLRYMRIHNLLELVTAKNLGTDEPLYDWSRLDQGLDLLHEHGILPFFELMGNPSGYFTNFDDDVQLHAWKRLVRDLVRHYTVRYGVETVEQWYFENWNEPDVAPREGGVWNHSDEAFLRYYDACSEGLKEANPKLRFGGPGTAYAFSPNFKALLEHCDRGTNTFTGETGVRIDFISIHEKGAARSLEQINPRTDLIIGRVKAVIDYIREHHPRLADRPIINNEADPQVGWNHLHSWRGMPYHASFAAKLITRSQRELVEQKKVQFPVLSNDDGFLGTWGNRSKLVTVGPQEDVDRGRFELIKKPILNLMTMLALLGDERIDATLDDAPADLGVLATRREKQIAILLYNQNDNLWRGQDCEVAVSIAGVTGPMRVAHYGIDDAIEHPYQVWERTGHSLVPDAPRRWTVTPQTESAETIYAQLREVQELQLADELFDAVPSGDRIELSVELSSHSVRLLLLSPDPGQAPPTVTGLRFTRWHGRTPAENILLQWDNCPSRVLRTFEVEYRATADDAWQRVNVPDLLDCAFMHVRQPNPRGGEYRVHAVDHWGRAGAYGNVLTCAAPK